MSFKKVAAKIAKKGGYSKKAASAILASASRKASTKAKRKNPKLKKVTLVKKPKSVQQVDYVSRNSEIQKRIDERNKYIESLLEDKIEDNEK